MLKVLSLQLDHHWIYQIFLVSTITFQWLGCIILRCICWRWEIISRTAFCSVYCPWQWELQNKHDDERTGWWQLSGLALVIKLHMSLCEKILYIQIYTLIRQRAQSPRNRSWRRRAGRSTGPPGWSRRRLPHSQPPESPHCALAGWWLPLGSPWHQICSWQSAEVH